MTDAERLDWLEAQARGGPLLELETCEGLFELTVSELTAGETHSSTVSIRRETLRELIDAAAEIFS